MWNKKQLDRIEKKIDVLLARTVPKKEMQIVTWGPPGFEDKPVSPAKKKRGRPAKTEKEKKAAKAAYMKAYYQKRKAAKK